VYFKADMDFWCNDAGFPHWGSQSQVCGKCMANRTDLPYKDLRMCAASRATFHDETTFRARWASPSAHPVMRWVADRGPFSFAEDCLHIFDYNGVTGQTLGSVLTMIVRNRELGHTSQAATLDEINRQMLHWYKQHGTPERLSELTMSMLVKDGQSYPCLSGPMVKGSTTRCLVPFVAHLCECTDDGSPIKSKLPVEPTAPPNIDRVATCQPSGGNLCRPCEARCAARPVHIPATSQHPARSCHNTHLVRSCCLLVRASIPPGDCPIVSRHPSRPELLLADASFNSTGRQCCPSGGWQTGTRTL
jgi:hypothetical protein